MKHMNIEIIYWMVLISVFVGLAYLGQKTNLKLWVRVVAALAIGAILGFIFGEVAASSKWIGDLFVRFIKMLVVPLIFTSLGCRCRFNGGPENDLDPLALKTISLYLLTTLFAITIGLILGTLFSPGAGIDITGIDPYNAVQSSQSIGDRLFGIVPLNPIGSLADGDVLPIIFFSILLRYWNYI